MLAEPAQDVSYLAVSKNHYYTQCNFKAALDGVISEVTWVVAGLEAVTGHHVKDSTPAEVLTFPTRNMISRLPTDLW
jgi:hypothetical protein